MSFEDHLTRLINYNKSIRGPGLSNISEITTHIFTINIDLQKNNQINNLLKDHDITNIITVGEEIKKKDKKINYFYIPIDEKSNITTIVNQCYQIIYDSMKNQEKILICSTSTGKNWNSVILFYYFLNRFYLVNFKRNYEQTLLIIDPDESFALIILKFLKAQRACIDLLTNQIIHILKIEIMMKKYFTDILFNEAKDFHFEETSEKDEDDFFQNNEEEEEDEENILSLIKKYLKKKFDKKNELKPDEKSELKPEEKSELKPEEKYQDKLEDLDNIF